MSCHVGPQKTSDFGSLDEVVPGKGERHTWYRLRDHGLGLGVRGTGRARQGTDDTEKALRQERLERV